MNPDNANNEDDDSDNCSNESCGFPSIDFSNVNFDHKVSTEEDDEEQSKNDMKKVALQWEFNFVFGEYDCILPAHLDAVQNDTVLKSLLSIKTLGTWLATGRYIDILSSSDIAQKLFVDIEINNSLQQKPEQSKDTKGNNQMLSDVIRNRLFEIILDDEEQSSAACKGTIDSTMVLILIELEILGVAALNLFLQSNYTGPSLHHRDDTTADNEVVTDSKLDGINPHSCFNYLYGCLHDKTSHFDETKKNLLSGNLDRKFNSFHNSILSELAVDGQWPCQVCYAPYFLLLARSIFSFISNPANVNWAKSGGKDASDSTDVLTSPAGCTVNNLSSEAFLSATTGLAGICIWNARSIVAQERLLQSREPSLSLWKEVEAMFEKCVPIYCPTVESISTDFDASHKAASIMLEVGLAEFHFDKPGLGRPSFNKAVEYSGLDFEVTGAIGKRTKFQYKATAQMLVKAQSRKVEIDVQENKEYNKDECDNRYKDENIQHSEEEILLERIKFDDDKENEIQNLSVLDQSILLALCLDVKNTNPADGLTNEEMGAYLARVLDHHDDWMIYSTGLLERAWVEFDRLHARERAILQIQALVDQHTNRLTITQSTRESIEESAPVQDRLKNLHIIVYPPRWATIEDLADRYASMGIVTSAAELYLEIELWDYVVECYKRAGRTGQAEKVVRERLAIEETPRMWNALGDITNDPTCYDKSIELSNGRFSNAFVSLASYYYQQGDFEKALENYQKALKVRPLLTSIWFRVGTISMQLERWDDALQAFSEVVMQEPEDAEAWANVAAVHMHNKKPAEAYPALVQSLKYKRTNWRVWYSKLFTCLDLGKWDEGVQACVVLLDLRNERQAKDGIPPLEEKCIRGIVGGVLDAYKAGQGNPIVADSARRTLTRVHAMLDRISTSSDAQPWIFETLAHLHSETGNYKELIDDLMKEYRALQAIPRWEMDDHIVRKIQQIVSQIVHIHAHDEQNMVENLTTSRFLIRGIIQKLDTARKQYINTKMPEEYEKLKLLLINVEAQQKKLSSLIE